MVYSSLGMFWRGCNCSTAVANCMIACRFEKLAGTATAKWHVSIKVLPSGTTIGKWLQQHGLPVLQVGAGRSELLKYCPHIHIPCIVAIGTVSSAAQTTSRSVVCLDRAGRASMTSWLPQCRSLWLCRRTLPSHAMHAGPAAQAPRRVAAS